MLKKLTVRTLNLKSQFSPEFRGRLDAEIKFGMLSNETHLKIIDDVANDLQKRLRDRNFDLVMTEDAKKWIAERGFDKKLGARPLKRIFTDEVTKEVSKLVLENANADKGVIIIGTEERALSFAFNEEVSNDNFNSHAYGQEENAKVPLLELHQN